MATLIKSKRRFMCVGCNSQVKRCDCVKFGSLILCDECDREMVEEQEEIYHAEVEAVIDRMCWVDRYGF